MSEALGGGLDEDDCNIERGGQVWKLRWSGSDDGLHKGEQETWQNRIGPSELWCGPLRCVGSFSELLGRHRWALASLLH